MSLSHAWVRVRVRVRVGAVRVGGRVRVQVRVRVSQSRASLNAARRCTSAAVPSASARCRPGVTGERSPSARRSNSSSMLVTCMPAHARG
eukprot:scaffold102188_cov58-Phaeocystis_antarctica.AAC.3